MVVNVSKKQKRIVLWTCLGIAGLIGFAVLVFAVWNTVQRKAMKAVASEQFPPPPLPSPNAYDDYIRASNLVVSASKVADLLPQFSRAAPPPPSLLSEADELLRENSRALQHVRTGIAHEYREPAVIPSYATLDRNFTKFSQFRTLARLLVIEGRVKEARRDVAGAADSFLAAVHAGEDLPRGGVIVTALTGYALSAIGRKSLWSLIGRLDAPTARRTARRLESLSERHVPFIDTLTAEREWKRGMLREALFHPDRFILSVKSEQSLNWPQRQAFPHAEAYLQYQSFLGDAAYIKTYEANGDRPNFSHAASRYGLKSGMASALLEPMISSYDKTWATERNGLTQLRLLATAFALRAHRLEHGGYPDSLDVLVNADLVSVPEDPFAPKVMLRYRKTGSDYLLYSVGPDGKDDNGTSIHSRKTSAGKNSERSAHRVELNSKGDIVAGINM